MMTVDAETDEEVQRRDLVKGYEFRKDQYLLLTDEDFDSVKVESSSVMNIEKFVEANSIDPIYFSSSYYLGTRWGRRPRRLCRALQGHRGDWEGCPGASRHRPARAHHRTALDARRARRPHVGRAARHQ